MQTHRFRLSELHSHPGQNETYGDLPAHEFDALKEDIARRGVRHPIEVTSSGMIVDGHQRVRACRELGIEEIDAIICQDEAHDAIDESFVLGNLLRRQLDPIARARAIQTLVDIERRRSPAKSDEETTGDFRDRIAKLLGGNVSGRTVDRHLQLLRLPPRIRHAVSARELPMITALALEKLSPERQKTIADRIALGESARKVAAEFLLAKPSTPQETPIDLYHMLMEFLHENIQVLDAESGAIVGTAGDHARTADILGTTAAFCRKMQVRERNAHRKSMKQVRDLIG